jgi:hypothetical protein
MARRMIVTAECPLDATKIDLRKIALYHAAFSLLDPRLDDFKGDIVADLTLVPRKKAPKPSPKRSRTK